MRRFLMMSVWVLGFVPAFPALAQSTGPAAPVNAVTTDKTMPEPELTAEEAAKNAPPDVQPQDGVDNAPTAKIDPKANPEVFDAARKATAGDKAKAKDTAKDKTGTATPAPLPAPAVPAAAGAVQTQAAAKPALTEVLAKDGDFSTFLALLKAAGMDAVLADKAPHTLFVPTDAAFKGMDKDKLDSLKKSENKAQLVDLLNYHVVNGLVPRAALDNNSSEVLTATLKRLRVVGKDGKLTVNGIKVGDKDETADNGVVYKIDKVIEAEAVRPAPVTAGPKAETGEKDGKKSWFKF